MSSECRKETVGLGIRGSILIGGEILPLNFLFSCSKASDAIVGIIANFVY